MALIASEGPFATHDKTMNEVGLTASAIDQPHLFCGRVRGKG